MEFSRLFRAVPLSDRVTVVSLISSLLFVVAVFLLLYRGLHLSVEFTGGTVIEVGYPDAPQLDPVRAIVRKLGYPEAEVRSIDAQDVSIRLPLRPGVTSARQSDQVMAALTAAGAGVDLRLVRFVEPQIGSELTGDSPLIIMGLVIGMALVYLSVRFQWKYASRTIIASLRDTVIILGVFAAFRWKFSPLVLAGLLVFIGFRGCIAYALMRQGRSANDGETDERRLADRHKCEDATPISARGRTRAVKRR